MADVKTKLERLLIESKLPGEAAIDTISMDFDKTQLGAFVLHLLLETAARQSSAVSYRGFNVSAGAYALKPGPFGHTIERGFGVNIKVDSTDTINIHAEDLAVGKAMHKGCDAVSVLTVIGPTQEDHASGLHTSTLHPCGRCRGRLQNNEIIRDDTLIITAREDFSVIDISDLEGIRRLHDENDNSKVRSFTLAESRALFEPLLIPENGRIVLGEEYEVDSSEWDETVVYI